MPGSLRSLEYTLDNIYNNLIKPNKNKYKIILFLYIPNDKNIHKIKLLIITFFQIFILEK